ncbi:unnamed protein product [Meganyctiphanes norvegica]|uniref:FP protein C-terminal domain-containing protein n=1 Tax=Meganyctiphanes norvegica TaxID=48144 RepID=A0AAV2RPS8_MEGNR
MNTTVWDKHIYEYKYPNAAIYEDVTPTRSRIMLELRNKKDNDNNRVYKYVWSKDGKIFIRNEDEAKRTPMPKRSPQRPEDLKKNGWTDQEIENIIIKKEGLISNSQQSAPNQETTN